MWNWDSNIVLDTYIWDDKYSIMLGKKISIDIVELVFISN